MQDGTLVASYIIATPSYIALAISASRARARARANSVIYTKPPVSLVRFYM